MKCREIRLYCIDIAAHNKMIEEKIDELKKNLLPNQDNQAN